MSVYFLARKSDSPSENPDDAERACFWAASFATSEFFFLFFLDGSAAGVSSPAAARVPLLRLLLVLLAAPEAEWEDELVVERASIAV